MSTRIACRASDGGGNFRAFSATFPCAVINSASSVWCGSVGSPGEREDREPALPSSRAPHTVGHPEADDLDEPRRLAGHLEVDAHAPLARRMLVLRDRAREV
jgi:hypothetical protein